MIFTNGVFLFSPLPAHGDNNKIEILFKKIVQTKKEIKLSYFGHDLYRFEYKNQEFLVGKNNQAVIFGPIINKRFHSYSLSKDMIELYHNFNEIEKVYSRILN